MLFDNEAFARGEDGSSRQRLSVLLRIRVYI